MLFFFMHFYSHSSTKGVRDERREWGGAESDRWSSQVAANQRMHATSTISAWPSAYCSHSAVMTPQSPEPRPPRRRRVPSNQSAFSVIRLPLHKLSQAAAAVNIFVFCTTEPMSGRVKKKRKKKESDAFHLSLFQKRERKPRVKAL